MKSKKFNKCIGPTKTKPIIKYIENGNLISINSVFIRKDIASKFKFNESRDLSGSEDFELWIRLSLNYEPITTNTVTTVIVQYKNRSIANISPEKAKRQILPFIELVKKNKSFIKMQSQKRRIISSLYCYLCLQLSYSKFNKRNTIYYCYLALRWSFNLLSLKKILVCFRNIVFILFSFK